MPTRERLAGETQQGAKPIVDFGWNISIIKTMFIIINVSSYGLLSHAAIFNPRRIKSIVLLPLASIGNSSKRG
jgi:hypothetical protein